MTDNVRKVFDMLGVKPNEKFRIRNGIKELSNLYYSGIYYVDENLNIYYFDAENKNEGIASIRLGEFLTGKLQIVKMPKIKKLRDLTMEEYYSWRDKNCFF